MPSEVARVCVAGLGTVGLPTALYMKERGVGVVGYDVSLRAVERARSEGVEAYAEWNDIPDCDAYVICVSTGLAGPTPVLSAVFDAARKVATRKPALVSVESTVTPGTCRKLHRDVFEGRFKVVHVPHRYWRGEPCHYGVRQLRVIGAVDEESLEAGLYLYRELLDIPLYVCPSVEVAEMAKLAENAYRFVQIALAEELKMVCEELGVDFEQVRQAANTKWNVDIPEARWGIGGHCLPKDTRYVVSLAPSEARLLRAAIEADESYRLKLGKLKVDVLELEGVEP